MGKVILSEQFSLNLRDLLKGLVMAALTPIVPIVMQSINAGSLVFDWKSIAIAAVGGLLAYLVKNFFEPTKVIETKPTEAKVEALKYK